MLMISTVTQQHAARYLSRLRQIRMHALHLGHPVMGDSLYGTEEGKTKTDRLMLHARKISFPHVRHTGMKPFARPFSQVMMKRSTRSGGRPVPCLLHEIQVTCSIFRFFTVKSFVYSA